MTLLAFKWFAILHECFLWLFHFFAVGKKLRDWIHHLYSRTTVLTSVGDFSIKQ